MNQIQAQLLRRIEAFCREAEISESMFGRLAVNDSKLVDRLRRLTVTLDTFHKINAFLDEQQLVARRQAFVVEQRAEIERHLAKHGGQLDKPKRRSRRKPDEPQLGA